MDEKIEKIKKWLGDGSINIFGIQFSGKDTVGKRLSELLNAQFISSGDVVRQNADNQKLDNKNTSDCGLLTPTKEFSELMENFLVNETNAGKPLVLSSVGRWIGEEVGIMKALESGGHNLRAVIHLEISKDEVYKRWEASKIIGDRAGRADDMDKAKIDQRIKEFEDKTLPVIEVYRQMGLLIEINGEQARNEVFNEVIDKLYIFSRNITS